MPPAADSGAGSGSSPWLPAQTLSGATPPQSPGRSSFLPSFMRRPRAATGGSSSLAIPNLTAEGLSNPPARLTIGSLPSQAQISSPSSLASPSTQQAPTARSTDSLASTSAGSPVPPQIIRRRTTQSIPQLQQQPQPQSSLRSRAHGSGSPNRTGPSSPPLSSSHREDPIGALGARLMRRISNHGSSVGSRQPTTAGPTKSNSTPPGGPVSEREEGEARASGTAPSESRTEPVSNAPTRQAPSASSSSANPPSAPFPTVGSSSSSAPTHRLRLVPMLETSHSLSFDPILRDVRQSTSIAPTIGSVAENGEVYHPIKIGRFTDKQNGSDGGPRGGALTSSKVAFKSKVVSRCHAEIWALAGGSFFVKDTKSSSGTFLNHQRLSPPGVESKPYALTDGDVLQLGVDYQGGTEQIFRSVKMRIEIGRAWQNAANSFNTNALKQLNALGGGTTSSLSASTSKEKAKKTAKTSVTDCCICLFSVTICQSLFIAPCSHVFHYKCIRPLLQQHYPGFSCPLCRSFADLEEDVETEDAWEVASRRESLISRKGSLKSVKLAFDQALEHALTAAENEPGDGGHPGDRQVAGNIGVGSTDVSASISAERGGDEQEGDENGRERWPGGEETAQMDPVFQNGFIFGPADPASTAELDGVRVVSSSALPVSPLNGPDEITESVRPTAHPQSFSANNPFAGSISQQTTPSQTPLMGSGMPLGFPVQHAHQLHSQQGARLTAPGLELIVESSPVLMPETSVGDDEDEDEEEEETDGRARGVVKPNANYEGGGNGSAGPSSEHPIPASPEIHIFV
ncbi:FOG: FHA domain [Phaffia rhodozyma]|uniref:FOG: FHA domain n=1 Tax=Phaffia rhodozyma TaxID=264483 RepID=A0A0F7SJK8_PHARH|nr:FOG: FHA domain [Phaffia rhodozyma]